MVDAGAHTPHKKVGEGPIKGSGHSFLGVPESERKHGDGKKAKKKKTIEAKTHNGKNKAGHYFHPHIPLSELKKA